MSKASLELIYLIMGRTPISLISGFKYYVRCIDDCSKYTWVFPMATNMM